MKRISLHQWTVLCGLILLGPALRVLPRLSAELAGRPGWLAALPVLPFLGAYAWFLSRLWEGQPAGTGLAELTLRQLGQTAGRPVLALYAVWFLFYAGFLLRAGADRLVVTVYPHSAPWPFTLSMGLLCLFASLGSLRSLARTAKILCPLLLFVLLTLLLLSLKGLRRSSLLPVTVADLPALLRGAPPLLDVLGLGLFLPLFLLGQTERNGPLFPRLLRYLLLSAALLSLLMLALIGNFGAGLVSQMTHPFFTLVRNLTLFHSLERIEALVVCCFIFPDFLLISLCLYAAQYSLRLALGAQPQLDTGTRLDMTRLRWLIPLCGAASILVGLLLTPDLLRLRRLSDRLIPGLHLALAYLTPPLLVAAGRLRTQGFRLPTRARFLRRKAKGGS